MAQWLFQGWRWNPGPCTCYMLAKCSSAQFFKWLFNPTPQCLIFKWTFTAFIYLECTQLPYHPPFLLTLCQLWTTSRLPAWLWRHLWVETCNSSVLSEVTCGAMGPGIRAHNSVSNGQACNCRGAVNDMQSRDKPGCVVCSSVALRGTDCLCPLCLSFYGRMLETIISKDNGNFDSWFQMPANLNEWYWHLLGFK